MNQRPIFRKPPRLQSLPGEDNLSVLQERRDLPRDTT